jgi:hypothetical protein
LGEDESIESVGYRPSAKEVRMAPMRAGLAGDVDAPAGRAGGDRRAADVMAFDDS